jgi:MscS family membrane protein
MLKVFITFSLIIYSQITFSQLSLLSSTASKTETKITTTTQITKAPAIISEKLKTPRNTMKTFLLAMSEVKKGKAEAFSDAISTIDLSFVDQTVRKVTGKITAERLINTIDRIAHIDLNHVPTYEEGPTWYFRKQTVSVANETHDVEIALYKTQEGTWKFTPETVNSIDNFYSSVAHLKVLDGVTEYRSWHSYIKDRMPEWTNDEFLIFKKGQWMGLLAILLISISFFGVARAIATFILRIKIKQKSLDLNEDEQYESTLPFGFLLFSLTWLVGVRQLEFDLEVLQIFTRGAYIATAFSAVWSTLKIVDYISLHFKKLAAKTTNRFDDVLVPMLSKTAKVLVLSFGALLIAHSLTFDVASILAGLGIGGVAVALAAKDTISNLFGSVTVLMDKPFHLGDYVVLEKGLEGTVEEVGFRSTRLRTPINSLVTLPNSVLANMAIDNYGMRKVRRFRTKLAIDYKASPSVMEEFCERIRYSVRMNPMVQTEDQVVSVYEITPNSIEILVSVYFLSSNMQSELTERQKLIFEIINIANELGVKFSQPVQFVQGNAP